MGLGDFFKKLFASEPIRVDYSATANERLLELWRQRTQLTEAAVAELQAEATRRGLELPSPGPPRPTTSPLPRQDPIVGPHLSVVPPGAVLLRTEGVRAVLCLLPTTEPGLGWLETLEKAPDVEVEALVVFNGGEGGLLPTSLVAERLRVPRASVYLLEPGRPADRLHASWPVAHLVAGAPMPKRLVRGSLRVGVFAERPNLVIARWSDVESCALIGPEVRLGDVAARSASHVIGGLVLEPHPDAVPAFGHLEEVVFFPEVVGVTPWPEPLAAMGVTASVAHAATGTSESTSVMERIGLAVTANDDAALAEAVGALALAQLEPVITAMLLNDREADAERIAIMACERHPQAGVAWFQRGVVAVLRGAPVDAVAAYQRATEVTTPDPRAWANLAAVYGHQQQWAEALRCAETAHRLMPDDAFSLEHRLRALLALGRQDDARAVAASSASPLRAPWKAALERGLPLADGPGFFPQLARAALDAALTVQVTDALHAVALLHRGLRFDPRLVAARLELTTLLGSLGRDGEAETVATEGLPWVQHPADLAALLFNRASARARSGHLEAACTDLTDCLELHPAFHRARAQLVSVLSARGLVEAAEAQLSLLSRDGVEPELLAALEAQLEEARQRRG